MSQGLQIVRALALVSLLTAASCELPPAELTGSPAPAVGDGDETIKDLYLLERMPRLRTGTSFRMFSSYDRTGGNDDGFSGRYSRLRLEGGDSVLAEVTGPGVIRRIYFAPSDWWRQDVLDGRGERIWIYLDGAATPALDLPLRDLFNGRHPRFPRPLVGSGRGGFYSYVPIPFAAGCKVVVQGQGVRFYQIGVQTGFPPGVTASTFSMKRSQTLSAAAQAWSTPGQLHGTVEAGLTETRVRLDLAPGASAQVELPPGANMVRAVLLQPPTDPSARLATLEAWLSLAWDGSATAAVRLPLGFLMGQLYAPKPYRSLLMGQRGEELYNLLPMPYRTSARLSINAGEKRVTGTVRLLTAPLDREAAASMAYLHAAYSDQRPTQVLMRFPWLIRQGTGHYVGTYLVTAGPVGLPTWMEGDERFMVDGRLLAHGTGHEEYFNTGWYMAPGQLDRPVAAPLSGVPIMALYPSGFRMTGYRWHLDAPIPYSGSFRAEIEHGPYNIYPANYRAAAYFYDLEPGYIPAVPSGE